MWYLPTVLGTQESLMDIYCIFPVQTITGSGKHRHVCLPSTVGLLGCQLCWHLSGSQMPSSFTPCLRMRMHLIRTNVLPSLMSPQWPPSPGLVDFSTDGEDRVARDPASYFPKGLLQSLRPGQGCGTGCRIEQMLET